MQSDSQLLLASLADCPRFKGFGQCQKFHSSLLSYIHDIFSVSNFKGQGHVTVNKPVISIIYIVARTWPLCSAQILVDGVNPQESYFQKSTNISAIIQHMSVSFVSLRSSRVHLQNNTFILRKAGESLCDMADQKYCKIVISKEVCLHCVTLPL